VKHTSKNQKTRNQFCTEVALDSGFRTHSVCYRFGTETVRAGWKSAGVGREWTRILKTCGCGVGLNFAGAGREQCRSSPTLATSPKCLQGPPNGNL